MPARTGKGRQRKGRSFERQVIQDLWGWIGVEPPWKKHARPDGGYRAPYPFDQWTIECKNQETLSIWNALAQAEGDAGVGGLPVVIFTRARASRYVALKFEDWCGLVKAAATEKDR